MGQTKISNEIKKTNINCRSLSTLLIPSDYIAYYNYQVKQHKTRSAYFNYLLIHFSSQISFFKYKLCKNKNQKWKTSYQKNGQSLEKKNFRPIPEIWEKLRNIADSLGISMAYLFVFLMELEMSGAKPLSFNTIDNNKKANIKKRGWNSNYINRQNLIEGVYSSRYIDLVNKTLKRKLILDSC